MPAGYIAERFVHGGVLSFRYLVTVGTATVDGRLVNTEADGTFDVHRFLLRYSGEGHWTIRDVVFPAAVPGWAFEADHIAEHAGETVPGL